MSDVQEFIAAIFGEIAVGIAALLFAGIVGIKLLTMLIRIFKKGMTA